jgi:hypothetical protein
MADNDTPLDALKRAVNRANNKHYSVSASNEIDSEKAETSRSIEKFLNFEIYLTIFASVLFGLLGILMLIWFIASELFGMRFGHYPIIVFLFTAALITILVWFAKFFSMVFQEKNNPVQCHKTLFTLFLEYVSVTAFYIVFAILVIFLAGLAVGSFGFY